MVVMYCTGVLGHVEGSIKPESVKEFEIQIDRIKYQSNFEE